MPASHLVVTRCCSCGADGVLAAPGRARTAHCTACSGSSVVLPAGSMAWYPVVGYPNPFGKVPWRPAVRVVDFPTPQRETRSPWPSAVEKLAQEAVELSWAVRRQSARGAFANRATGRPGVVRDSFALVFGEHGGGSRRRAYAVYTNGSWQSICVYGPDLPWFMGCSVTDLRGFLAEPDRPAAWLDAIRVRNAARKAA